MKIFKRRRNSIKYRFTAFVLALIIFQSTLLSLTLIAGGVLKESKSNAFKSFDQTVSNRKDYIQMEMNTRWTNFDPYVGQISALLPKEGGDTALFFKEAAPIVISILRTTMTNGAFIILEEQAGENPYNRKAMYFRDYDPLLNDETNKDIYYVSGSYDISQNMQIPLDLSWSYSLELTDDNKSFYEKPINNSYLSKNASHLGYWSQPFKLSPEDHEIITYTIPLFDSLKNTRGIIGIEIAVADFNKLFPSTDLGQRALGYLIGYKASENDEIRPLILNGAFQQRIIDENNDLILQAVDGREDIYLLNDHNARDNLYVNMHKIRLYDNNTPFENEEWFLIGVVEERDLLSFFKKMQNVLMMSLVLSILIGGIGGLFISKSMSRPIINLANEVLDKDDDSPKGYARTGYQEIDKLAKAIEDANEKLIESSNQISRIIDLVDMPIAAFEYKEDEKRVFVTDQLQEILMLSDQEKEAKVSDKEEFKAMLSRIMNNSEPEEEHVYKLKPETEKWIKISIKETNKSVMGLIVDVTKEIIEKNKIKQDRDQDSLTEIYNRAAFARKVNLLISENDISKGAFLMLDLDHLKPINDTYGHIWGDKYIKKTAELLSIFSEAGGIVGRQSGDEFLVFLYGFSSCKQIKKLVDSFYDSLGQNTLDFPDKEKKRIRISAGLVWIDKNGSQITYQSLLNKADMALYAAKNHRKGTWISYDEKDKTSC